MKLNLEKWLNNKTDANFKRIFNDNVDKINALANFFKNRDSATNSRIDNLVLRSGGPSHNEVVDARVDFLGVQHETLKGRLDADSKYLEEKFNAIDIKNKYFEETIKTLFDTLEKLYSTIGEPVRIYVSEKRGSNTSGDGTEERPYKTIQKAVDKIPSISSANYYVVVEPGAYKENVFVNNKFTRTIEILGSNLSTVDVTKGDTGVYVTAISFYNCPNYCAVRGITQIDVHNATENNNRFIGFIAVEYGAIEKCKASENTKAISGYTSFYYDRSKGHIYDSLASNQNIVLHAMFSSLVRISSNVSGKDNTLVVNSNCSIVFSDKVAVIGTTAQIKGNGGQIFEG